jgi:hypothetical protein
VRGHGRSAFPLAEDDLIREHRAAVTRALADSERRVAWWMFVAVSLGITAFVLACVVGVLAGRACP